MSGTNVVGRRRFLTGLAGLFVAPAIVRAESLMKLWVPPQKLSIRGRGMTSSIIAVDELAFLESECSSDVLARLGADYDGDVVSTTLYPNGDVFMSRYPFLNLANGQLFHNVNGKLVAASDRRGNCITTDTFNISRRDLLVGRRG